MTNDIIYVPTSMLERFPIKIDGTLKHLSTILCVLGVTNFGWKPFTKTLDAAICTVLLNVSMSGGVIRMLGSHDGAAHFEMACQRVALEYFWCGSTQRTRKREACRLLDVFLQEFNHAKGSITV